MTWFKPVTRLDKAYAIGLGLKGLDGLLEVASAALLWIVQPDTITRLTHALTQGELSTDPHDFIANAVLRSGEHLANGGTTFAVAYLMIHGLIKLVVVVSLFLQKRWAYPLAFVTLGLFLAYQAYLLGAGPSLGLLLLTAFDAVVLWLIWKESRRHRPATLAEANSPFHGCRR